MWGVSGMPLVLSAGLAVMPTIPFVQTVNRMWWLMACLDIAFEISIILETIFVQALISNGWAQVPVRQREAAILLLTLMLLVAYGRIKADHCIDGGDGGGGSGGDQGGGGGGGGDAGILRSPTAAF